MYKNNILCHYLIGDNMKELLWDLFKNTGKIEYYIKYREELKSSGKKD